MTRISIITVCRNDIKGLRHTFENIQGMHSDADFEWCVIDGNSTDGTVEWLREHHKVRGSWISEDDNGIYDAMNKGIRLATGKYTLFMNSGDGFAGNDVISNLIRHIDGEKIAPDFIFGDSLDFDRSGKVFYRKALPVSYIKAGMITRHQAMLYRTELVFNEPYLSSFKLSGDYALTAGMLMKKDLRVLQVHFPICRFSLGGVHDTGRFKALSEDFKIRRKILKMNSLNCSALFCAHWLHHYMRKLAPALNNRFIYKTKR